MAYKDLTDDELSAKYDAEFLKLLKTMNYSQKMEVYKYIKALTDTQHNGAKKKLS